MFIAVIRHFHLYGGFLDAYRMLKASALGIRAYYFPHTLVVFVFFAFILTLTGVSRRYWCRVLCPLGAVYALAARNALLRRVAPACSLCGRCRSKCRMAAIKEDMDYVKSECILCMDCIYDCPQAKTRFSFDRTQGGISRSVAPDVCAAGKISRRDFFRLFGGTAFLGIWFYQERKERAAGFSAGNIRPPGALKEAAFLNRCVRCGNCMKVCPTSGLQPLLLSSGLSAMWTPRLVPEIGYCEYNCNLCGKVCPTGAIPLLSLRDKQKKKLGIAKINRRLCLPWAKNKDCIVCEEHCPVPEKAIKLKPETIESKTVLSPYIDEKSCIGCGICQTKCPTRPERAVRMFPFKSDRG